MNKEEKAKVRGGKWAKEKECPLGQKLLYGRLPGSPMTPKCLPRWALLDQPETGVLEKRLMKGLLIRWEGCVKGNHKACGITHKASNHADHYLHCCGSGLRKELWFSMAELGLEARKQGEQTLNLPQPLQCCC